MGLHSKGIEKTSSSLPVKLPYSFMPAQKRQVRFDNAQIAIQGSKAQVSPRLKRESVEFHDRNCRLFEESKPIPGIGLHTCHSGERIDGDHHIPSSVAKVTRYDKPIGVEPSILSRWYKGFNLLPRVG